jgi:hypothetical protein
LRTRALKRPRVGRAHLGMHVHFRPYHRFSVSKSARLTANIRCKHYALFAPAQTAAAAAGPQEAVPPEHRGRAQSDAPRLSRMHRARLGM